MEEKLLYTSNENLDMIQVEGILKENKIPYLKKTHGAGQYINITMGTSFEEQSIYVNEDNYEEAKKLISIILEQDVEINDEINYEDNLSDLNFTRRYSKFKKIFTIIFIELPIILIIILLLMSLELL